MDLVVEYLDQIPVQAAIMIDRPGLSPLSSKRSLQTPLALLLIRSAGQGLLPVLLGLTLGTSLLGVASCAPPPTMDGSASSPTASSPSVSSTPRGGDQAAQLQGQQLPISATAQFGDVEISLEVAETPGEQSLGLMYRPALSDNRGMLFPFSPPRPVNFWMMNVPVPLDMVFVYRGVIKGIAPEAPPCSNLPCPTYGPGNQIVDYVIELRGGRAAELGLAVGDPVTITRQ